MRCSGLLDNLTAAGGRKPTWEHSGAKLVLWNTEVTWWSAWLSGGGRRFRRLAGNESRWSKVTPKSKTRETPGSLNFAANFRRGSSRAELVKSPFGRPRKPGCLTPHAFALFTLVSKTPRWAGRAASPETCAGNRVTLPVRVRRAPAAIDAPFFLFLLKEPRLFWSYCDASVERLDGQESTRREPDTAEQRQENPHGDNQKTITGSRHARRRSYLLSRSVGQAIIHVHNLNTFISTFLKSKSGRSKCGPGTGGPHNDFQYFHFQYSEPRHR